MSENSRKCLVHWYIPELNITYRGRKSSEITLTLCVLCVDHSSYWEGRRKSRILGSRKHFTASHWGTLSCGIEHKLSLLFAIILPIFSAIPSSLQRGISTRCILSAPWRRLFLPHWDRIWETWHTASVVVRTCWEGTLPMGSSNLWKSVFISCSAAGVLKRSWTEIKEKESRIIWECDWFVFLLLLFAS